MVTPEVFRQTFGADDLTTFHRTAVSRLNLHPADADWLIEVGLPDSAPPFLSFGQHDLRGLPTVDDHYDSPGLADPRYRIIGTTAGDNPIAVDVAADGAIFYLAHDGDFRPAFVNTTVRQLATCLVAYARLVAATQLINGKGAFLNGQVPPSVIHDFTSLVERADPAALEPGQMWADELESLRADSGPV
jgi:hypothetical protein